jgi:DNA-directed RNA polymerase specialized sigma subunit
MEEQYIKDVLIKERQKMKKIKVLENIITSLEKRNDSSTREWDLNIKNQIIQLSKVPEEFWEIVKSPCIDDLERSVLMSYFLNGKTFRKIATDIGYSSHVSIIKIVEGAIKKIKSNQINQRTMR